VLAGSLASLARLTAGLARLAVRFAGGLAVRLAGSILAVRFAVRLTGSILAGSILTVLAAGLARLAARHGRRRGRRCGGGRIGSVSSLHDGGKEATLHVLASVTASATTRFAASTTGVDHFLY
jgi:hypothetical protein